MTDNDEVKRLELINQVEPHIKNLTTVRSWNKYAKEHELPSAVTLIHYFGSWNNVKQALGLKTIQGLNKDELLTIAKKHSKYFTSRREWREYAKANQLPTDITYINVFGSWNKVKDILQMEYVPTQKPIYSREQIIKILKVHGKNLENRTQWDEYAKEHDLPTYKTIRTYLTWDEVLKITGTKKKRNFTEEDLIEIAKKHYYTFMSASIRSWNHYAKEHELPSSYVFIRKFGTWKKAKIEMIKKIQK